MIVLINPNSTVLMTEAMTAVAQDVAGRMKVEGWTSHGGPPSIQGREDGDAAVPPMLELVQKACRDRAEAILIGCFDDTGIAEAQKLARCPVIGIGQAAYHLAAAVGGRFSVVTTLDVSVPVLEENVASYGLAPSLGRIRASGVPVLEVEKAEPRIIDEILAAEAEDGVGAVALGCGGMVGLMARAQKETRLILVDGVRAATGMARALIA